MATRTDRCSVQGEFNLSVGDNISLMVADLDNPVKDVDVTRANIYMERVGRN